MLVADGRIVAVGIGVCVGGLVAVAGGRVADGTGVLLGSVGAGEVAVVLGSGVMVGSGVTDGDGVGEGVVDGVRLGTAVAV